jgi:multidrug resistance efflux pump
MLELSDSSIKGRIKQDEFESFRKLSAGKNHRVLKRSLFVLLGVLIVLLCLPWTQNISGNGRLTSLRPDQRPQAIQTIIPGKVEQWYVSEGDFVKAGDTIMRISEIKDDYFDPNLLVNVEDQIKSKESSVSGYMQKVAALDRQIDALNESAKLKRSQQELKIKQSILKVQSDSMDFNVVKGNAVIARDQYERFKSLFEKGLKSETELEQREVAYQNARAKQMETENKLLMARQELTNARTELNTISQDFRDKVSKAESDKFSTMSVLYDTEAQVTKLQSQFAGYTQRSGFYFITSPADGYVTRAIKTGIGETIKEGEEIVSLMPANYELAVELMVKPIDYPLLSKGQKVRFIFDGWPAFVFSGWPGASAGTYGGVVVAIDNFTNNQGE